MFPVSLYFAIVNVHNVISIDVEMAIDTQMSNETMETTAQETDAILAVT